jgi:hypothetical protein
VLEGSPKGQGLQPKQLMRPPNLIVTYWKEQVSACSIWKEQVSACFIWKEQVSALSIYYGMSRFLLFP